MSDQILNPTLKQIIEIIKRCDDLEALISAENILPSSHFQQDLGFDSLALMSLLYELQDLYPHLDESHIAGWKTLQDCVLSCQGQQEQ